MIRCNRSKYPAILPAAALATAAAMPGSALALSFEAGGWSFDVDTTLGAAAQWRTEKRDKKLSTSPENWNFNDGNNNFDRGSLTSAKASFILEVAGQYENFSFFIRGDGLYDTVYMDNTSDLSVENYESYNNAIPNGGTVKRGDFPDGTLDEQGRRLRLLDAFVNYEFELGSQFGSIRLGRQVISWGEGFIFQSVNSLQNPADGSVALSPGVEAKEIFLPTNAVDLKLGFNDQVSAEVYYKLQWEETTQPGVGSFLSPNDVTGPGAQRTLVPEFGQTFPVVSPQHADDYGQWGAAMRYVTDYGTSFSLSYVRGNANTPGVRVVTDLDTFETYSQEIYPEDIKFWQFGVSTIFGETSVYADLVYSENAPFNDITQYVNDKNQLVSSDSVRGHYTQFMVGIFDTWTAFPWLSERIDVIAEVVYMHNNLGTSDRETNPYLVTDDALAYQLNLRLNYFSVLPGLDLVVPISYRHDVDGYGASAVNPTYEDQMQASIGIEGLYLSNWKFEVKYSFYFGNDDVGEPLWSDRDNVAIGVKYKF